ncbi:efflux RND transporter periplasmic adaptor subunit [Corallococcus llansteffanensis]|uniref:HlyD family efflux transporter periplasmic adaptor subunit n=1 Tax=Corallococcus llansteffanensis TaxID=2316731 RepID=A0A3A8PD50_9BACT|nr:HlyD family efflux transporter periplasmic adaptor subunit [Corallococcus llansteffanensis]RKH54328.1 HlyD family efflux transporter periplasmic adaptor subunit [Corallococcus llansteffanensis]
MEEKPSIFRKEALDYFQQHRRKEGDVLRLAPPWTKWAYGALMSMLAVGLLVCTLGEVSEYASGPALIRVERRTDITTPTGGVVATVDVQPGQRVAADHVLMTLQADEERLSLTRSQHELELHLVRYMRDLTDQSSRQALTTLRAEQELAQSRLEARSLRTSVAGVVGDLRIQVGQYLAPGTRVASLVEDDAPVSLQAFLPGYYRPFLKPGMMLRIEMEGFRYEYRELPIESVGDQIIGPGELQRYLGPELAGAMELKGPLVLVRARIPSRTFRRNGREFGYFDGMPAHVEAAVRSESILLALLPGLKALLPHEH